MSPIKFAEQNRLLAKDQKEYLPLPVHQTQDGLVISCWRLTWWDRLKLLFTGRLWLMQLTFGEPLQPQVIQAHTPFRLVPNSEPQRV